MHIGIDLGGTKIEGILLDLSGEEIERQRTPTPSGDYRGTVNAIVQLSQTLEINSGTVCTVGIATPGSISPHSGLHRNANSSILNGQNFLSDLENSLGKKIWLGNDANCFTLSEAVDGAGKGNSVVFGIILGTGVGAGITINGKIHNGRNSIAGEWGHNSLPWPSSDENNLNECFCGRKGCIETFLSGPALLRDYKLNGGQLDTVEEMVKTLLSEEIARRTIDRYADRLGRALAHIINVLDPDVIVLGGGLSNILYLYETAPRKLKPYVFSDACCTRIVQNRHGDSSGVRGAAWLGATTIEG